MRRPRPTDHTSKQDLLERCVLEIAGRPAGILVREGNAYVFFSARRQFRTFDWVRFKSIGTACRKLETFAAPQSHSG